LNYILAIGLAAYIASQVDWRRHREAFVAGLHQAIEAEIPRLRRYAWALTRDAVLADDLVQDCLTRALAKLHLWQRGTDLHAWLFTILHNQYVNYVRRSVREGAGVRLSDNEPSLACAPQQGQGLELRDLGRAIAKLSEEQRSTLLLVGLEGMRYEEVATVLDVPVGTIRSRLSRGREALRRFMGLASDAGTGRIAARRFTVTAAGFEMEVSPADRTSRQRTRPVTRSV
jgi:RNA polymerase sigma-70 factor (ECF subfamily)